MDGMELSRLKKEFPEYKNPDFTGFDEFEYAKEVVHLEVEEYILKPIDSAELTKNIQTAESYARSEMDEKGTSRSSGIIIWIPAAAPDPTLFFID